MANRPYVRPANVPGPRASRVSDLLLSLGQSEGARERAKGDRAMQTAAIVADTVGRATGQVASYYQDAPKRELEQLQLGQAKKSVADQTAAERAVGDAKGDLGQAIVALEAAGSANAADLVRTKLAQRQSTQFDAAIKGYDLRSKQYGEANRLLAAVRSNPGIYPQVGPQLAQIAEGIQKGWGAMVPPHYDPKTVDALYDFSMTEEQRAARLKTLAETSEKERAAKKTQTELDSWGRDYLAQYFALLDPQQATDQDYQGAVTYMKDRGVSPQVMSLFGTDAKQAVDRAHKLLSQKDAADGDLSFDEYLSGVAKKAGRPVSSYVGDELLDHKSKYEATKRDANGDTGVNQLTPEALDMASHQFAVMGVMPTLGQGKTAAATRAAIINNAAKMYEGLDLPTQIAAYNAAKAALGKRTEQLSAITAFEETAQKNLERLLALSKKIPDLKSPWLNQPVRTLSNDLFGSTDMARFRTQLTTTVPEFARIISNPNLTGVLSDDARHEVQTILSGDYTTNQILGAAEELMRDAGNRKTSLEDEIGALTRRMASPPRQRPAETEAVPKAVQDLLGSEPDDEYTLSDGTTWVKKNGVLTKKPK